MPWRSRTSSASRYVVGSGAQGPEAMCVGSSPVTSDMMSASTGALDAAASRPPRIAERCFRTVFISWIGAPLRSNSLVVAFSASMPTASTGRLSSAEPPPETSASSRSPGAMRPTFFRISFAADSPVSSGTGCPASITLMRRVGSPCPWRVMTRPSSAAPAGQCRSTASAIEAAALPAPMTSVLPDGGAGRWFGRILSGSAAATAASKLCMSNCFGSMRSGPRYPEQPLYSAVIFSADLNKPLSGLQSWSSTVK